VVLVRVARTAARPRVMALLEAAATGGMNLQRVLSLDPDRGQAVLQAPTGEQASPPADRRTALAQCEALGRALSPLHQQGLAHGAVTAEAVTAVAGWTMLELVPALSTDEASAAGDVEATLRLADLPPMEGVEDGAALEQWARQQQAHEEADAQKQRRERLLQEALANAPED